MPPLFLQLHYITSSEPLQKSTEKLLENKIVALVLKKQCFSGSRDLARHYILVFVSISEHLPTCEQLTIWDCNIIMYTYLFREFGDCYSTQGVLGILVTGVVLFGM